MPLQSVNSIYLEKLSAVQRVLQEKTTARSESIVQPQQRFEEVLARVMEEGAAAEPVVTSTAATLKDDLANLGLDPNDPLGLATQAVSSSDSLDGLMKTMQTMMVVNMQQNAASALFSDGSSSADNSGFSSLSNYSNTIMMSTLMNMMEKTRNETVSTTPLPVAAASYTEYDM